MNRMGWAVAAVLSAGLAIFVWQVTQPGPDNAAAMKPADTSALPRGAPIAQVRLPAQLSGDAMMGQRAFEAKCATCHGANAAGQNGVAPPLVHKTYRPGHHSDMAFYLAAQNGVRAHHWRFGNMPPVDGLTRADVTTIVAYVRELQRANGIN